MTLVNRVSAFFLLALGVCLVGYSAAMYFLIREHLFHQFDSQLNSALNVLVAAVEVEPDGVKWQPSDHTINLGNEREEDEVRWLIVNEVGGLVDSSHNLRTPDPADRQLLSLANPAEFSTSKIRSSGQWRYLQQRLACTDPKPESERDVDESAELLVTVARDAVRLNSDLWRLGLLASTLPIGLWIAAAVSGRSYCRKALQPVGAMAERARSMTSVDFDLRLPVSHQHDELASLATAFNSLLDRLRQAYQQQQRFTGDAAHQLRTPLTVLRGEIDVALRRPRDVAEHRRILELLSAQTNDLQKIVETLLFLARTENDTSPPDGQEIFLDDWLRGSLTHWQSHPRFRDLTVKSESGAFLSVSVSLLQQALDNLIGNALKYSPAGSPVQIGADADAESVSIWVEDHGNGIPEDERTAIFDPFYRSASARQTGVAGTGLGLAIVARIATALGGSVRCEQAHPQGSRFILHLSRVRCADRTKST
ncbi:ATP-binding protein [Planctomicrobium sp. SH661]|uniref:ATP-binding protein n=1 Tax=Planctomicrobium sp. SH661 TaxID=3448124 RepID=UPI003F5BE45E